MNNFNNTLAISGVIRDIPKLDAKGNYVCQGTIHFSPGTKIYVLPPSISYDMCNGRIKVIGYHKDDGSICQIWMRTSRAHKWALEQLTDLDLLSQDTAGWDRELAEGMLKYLLHQSGEELND